MWVCLRARVSVCVCESESSTQANPSSAPNAAGSTPWHSLKADITRAWHAIHKQSVHNTHTQHIPQQCVYIHYIYTRDIYATIWRTHINYCYTNLEQTPWNQLNSRQVGNTHHHDWALRTRGGSISISILCSTDIHELLFNVGLIIEGCKCQIHVDKADLFTVYK